MATIKKQNEKSIHITTGLEDAVQMGREAARDVGKYAHDIVTIYEKMPAFDYTNFCFYAYDSATLFEFMLGLNPREYTAFSLDAPDEFFYALYGAAAALYPQAKRELEPR